MYGIFTYIWLIFMVFMWVDIPILWVLWACQFSHTQHRFVVWNSPLFFLHRDGRGWVPKTNHLHFLARKKLEHFADCLLRISFKQQQISNIQIYHKFIHIIFIYILLLSYFLSACIKFLEPIWGFLFSLEFWPCFGGFFSPKIEDKQIHSTKVFCFLFCEVEKYKHNM